MQLDAIFVVEEVSLEIMSLLHDEQKLDYFLGEEESTYFENHLIDMEDFFIYPKEAYQLFQRIVKCLDELDVKELDILYQDTNICLCVLSNEKIYSLKGQIQKRNWEEVIEYFIDINDIKLSNPYKQQLVAKFKSIDVLLNKAIKPSVKTIVSFRKENAN